MPRRTLIWIGSSSLALTLVPLALAQTSGSNVADADGDGVVTRSEFRSYLDERAPNLPDAMAERIVTGVDLDADGTISADEFDARMTVFQAVVSGQAAAEEAEEARPAPRANPQEPVSIAPLTASDEVTLLLITADEIAEAWRPFASWKTRQGKATTIITVREIEARYEASSIQEKIRLCVREHIDERNTRWVLLGGDCVQDGGLVPGGHRTVHRQERDGIPTDIVYLSPTDWDADGDGVYGEFADDQDAITYPDGSVGLGRVPVRTADDVRAFTQKVIAYESAYPTDDFAQQMIYTCTDSPAYPKVRASWDRYVSKAWDGEARRFFNTETPWDEEGKPGSHDLSDANLTDLVNTRSIGKLHIHGHGLIDRWVLEGSYFQADDVERLSNQNAYPLITTVSCFTGEYDAQQDPSIVESMLRAPNAGSVAIVAPVRTGKPHFHSPSDFRLMVSEGKLDGTTMTMTKYWAAGLGDGLTTGESLMSAKQGLTADARKSANYHLCLCELNLLGDPTLDMRAAAPRAPSMRAPEAIDAGVSAFTVVTDAPGATVCVWKGLEVYEVRVADKDGRAPFRVHATTPGDLLVTVSGQSLNTQTSSIRVR